MWSLPSQSIHAGEVGREGVRLWGEPPADEMIQTSPPSGIAPQNSRFYQAVTSVIEKHSPGAGVFPLLMASATDGRYWRQRGYPAYGFTPVILERSDIGRVHGIDERLSKDNLILGIKMTIDILKELCA